jgi:hypothetical protein
MSNTPATPVDSAIKAEALRRIKAAEAERLVAASLATEEARKKRDAIELSVLEEQVRLRAQEEQIRIMAQRLAAEGEAKRLAKEREEAIAAEILRLSNRSEVEVLRDTVADLQAQIAELKSYRQ